MIWKDRNKDPRKDLTILKQLANSGQVRSYQFQVTEMMKDQHYLIFLQMMRLFQHLGKLLLGLLRTLMLLNQMRYCR